MSVCSRLVTDSDIDGVVDGAFFSTGTDSGCRDRPADSLSHLQVRKVSEETSGRQCVHC